MVVLFDWNARLTGIATYLMQKLGLDLDQLGIDAEAIEELDRRENNKGDDKMKFVSPYASSTSLDNPVCTLKK